MSCLNFYSRDCLCLDVTWAHSRVMTEPTAIIVVTITWVLIVWGWVRRGKQNRERDELLKGMKRDIEEIKSRLASGQS